MAYHFQDYFWVGEVGIEKVLIARFTVWPGFVCCSTMLCAWGLTGVWAPSGYILVHWEGVLKVKLEHCQPRDNGLANEV